MSAQGESLGAAGTASAEEAKAEWMKPERPKIALKVEHIAAGRARVMATGGVLEHTDQLQMFSDRQRLRFAQACNLKLEGCLNEVQRMLEREADSLRYKVDPKTDDYTRILFTSAGKFLAEPVDWIWKDRIPAGSVTILEGDPGVGKSLLLVDLAARVSRGFLAPDRHPTFDEPGHDPEPYPGVVWWFSGHDNPERTLNPRLAAAGANMDMVRIAEGIEDQKTNKFRPIQFPQDFNALRKSRSECPRLVIVDPLSSFCGGSLHLATNHKVLVELSKFAAETGAAVVVVRPLNRRVGASACERGSAGPMLTAEARSALLLAVHPEDSTKRVLAVVKSNLSAIAPSLELEIRGSEEWRVASGELKAASDASDSLHSSLSTPHSPIISWHGAVLYDADELVRVGCKSGASKQRTAIEQKKVEDWLNEKLSDGPKPVTEIDRQALLDEVPPSLLKRAKVSLGVVPIGTNGHTRWKLPGNDDELDKELKDEIDSILGDLFKPERESSEEAQPEKKVAPDPTLDSGRSRSGLAEESIASRSRLAEKEPKRERSVCGDEDSNLSHHRPADKKILPTCGGGGELASRRGESARASNTHANPTTPPTRRSAATSPTSGEVLKGTERRHELRQTARDVTRNITRSPEWKQMVAAGEIPEHLVAYAESIREDD